MRELLINVCRIWLDKSNICSDIKFCCSIFFHTRCFTIFVCCCQKHLHHHLKRKNFLLLSVLSFITPQIVLIQPIAEEIRPIVWAVLLSLKGHFTNSWLKLRGIMNLAFLLARTCSIIIAIWFNCFPFYLQSNKSKN